MRDRFAVSPKQYRRVADATLIALSLIVMTGAAVRLTGSGLGCPHWPKCYGGTLPPLSTHALIEFGNRALSGLVGVLTVIACLLAAVRRPFRRDLLLISLTLPVGVLAQGVLGGFTVREHLAPGFVMGHFCLSMIILIGAVALAWRARHEPGSRPRVSDRLVVWSVRGLSPLAALAIFAGTAATAAGPHAGGSPGQKINRLTFKGADTLQWMVHQHATIAALLGVATIAVWFLRRQRGADLREIEPITVLGVLLAAQGLVGSVQYELRLPTDIVWVHVALATATWLVVLWAVADAGRLSARRAGMSTSAAEVPARELEAVSR
jgi:cytochrome c oxidase assembly protein subunit 15